MLCVTSRMDATITPEPDEAERAAVLEALAGGKALHEGGWAAAALAEGVSAADADPLQEHDVCSLW